MTASSTVRALPLALLVAALAPASPHTPAPAALHAQEPATADAPDTLPATPIGVADPRADSLPSDGVHRYAVDLEAGWFVYGHADQESVDVVVTVLGPDGGIVRRVDGPSRGPERFWFDTRAAGEHRIEISPFEEGTGRYTLVLERAEPAAEEPAARVDQLMTPYSGGGVPGGVVGVVRDGRLVFAEAYGAADLTHDVPFTVDTRTNIGSTSKQFTAFAVALLAERGELSLDDDVREHIPELPQFGTDTVRLRHLLTHTSGYREFLNTLALTGRRIDEGDHVDRSEIVGLVERQPELQNEPGAEWNYNNTGFALLTLVVERVTGTPFPEWMQTNVFEPLGMHDTRVRAHPSHIVENSARGYVPTEEGWRNAPDLSGAMGAGGIYTTVADLARWIENLATGRLGGPAVVEEMTTPYVLTTGDTTEYGLGLFVDEERGLRRVQHGGADIAHRAMLAWYPEIDGAVITLSNNATFAATITPGVSEAFFGDRMEPAGSPGDAGAADAAAPDAAEAAPTVADPADLAPATLDDLVGRYELEVAPGFVLTVTREDDRLFAQATGQPRVPLAATSDTTFAITVVDASLTFHRDESGEVSTLTLHQNGDHLAHRIEDVEWAPSEADLEAYAGRYYSEELETFYTVEIVDGRPAVRHRRFPEAVGLTPTGEDRFSGTFPVASLEFERDERGRVTGLSVSNGRTRGVGFEKVE